ncbi:MAG TPA: transcription termination factor Rho [Acidimicrobiales bacterium]|nr:transcription termination factor Rho [Acidimicrobiales bacterium]
MFTRSNEVQMTITGDTERSALESKDRQQLATIARALGGNPTARSRKDELVDLILALTDKGAGAPGDGDDMSEQTTEDAAATTDDSAADGGGDAAVETAERNGSGNGSAKADEGEHAEDRSDDAAGESEKAEKAERSDDKRERSERSDDKRGDRSNRKDGDGGGQQRNRDGQRNQGGNRNQGGGGGNQGDDAEPGNRKRRRRGRNQGRDRDEDTGPVQDWDGEPVEVAGLLDLRDEGYGFLRLKGVMPSRDDVYVSVKQVRQFGMRKGDRVTGASRPANRNEKNPALLRVDTVNDMEPEKAKARPKFEDLTPLFPDERLRLEEDGDPGNMTARIIDLISPIGKGQRGLIVSPPKAGKTTIMKQIAKSIEANNPEVKLMVLLVDERPEEVTDMRRTVKGEVIASTFDRPADEHTSVAELAIDRAKRMVEMGEDVVIILDGITRLSRAYNLAAPATGRIMSGGIDTGALYPPKRFFGAARNLEEGGSLTILATALVETGSKMDEVIFEEFKGTGNMELRLDRKLAERRIYPAIDVDASSTRHEELLFERKQLQQVWKLRRVLSGLADGGGGGTQAGLELLIDRLKTFKNNDEFLAEVAKGPSIAG